MSNSSIYSTQKIKRHPKGLQYWLFLLWYVSWIIYFGHIFLENNILTKIALSVVLTYNLFFAIVSPFYKYNRHIKYFNAICLILLLLFSSYYLISPKQYYSTFNQEWIVTFGDLKLEWFVLGSIFPCIYYSSRNFITEKLISWTLLVLIAIGAASYYFQLNMLVDRNGQDAMNVNNMGYLLAVVMVYIPFIKNKILAVIILLLCTALSLLSLKRGAMMVSLSSLVIIIWYWSASLSKKKMILQSLLFALLLAVGIYLMQDLYLESELLQSRIGNGVTSGARGEIWNKLLEAQFSGPLFNCFFGNGFNSSIPVAGNYAHNEWIEILYDYGFIGFFFYIMFYYCFIKAIVYLKRHSNNLVHLTVMILLLISMLLKSMFSMLLNGVETIAPIVLLAYMIVITYGEQKENIVIH